MSDECVPTRQNVTSCSSCSSSVFCMPHFAIPDPFSGSFFKVFLRFTSCLPHCHRPCLATRFCVRLGPQAFCVSSSPLSCFPSSWLAMPSAARAPSGPPAPPTGEKVDEFFQLLEQQVPFPAAELEQLIPAALLQHWKDLGRDAERRVAMGHAVRTVPRQFSDTQRTVSCRCSASQCTPSPGHFSFTRAHATPRTFCGCITMSSMVWRTRQTKIGVQCELA